jgi:hypothetical protein
MLHRVRRLTVVLVGVAGAALVSAAAGGERPGTGKAVMPFNGKDLTTWKVKGPEAKSKWVVGYATVDPINPSLLAVNDKGEGPPQMVDRSRDSLDIYTEQKFGDCTVELEFMIPKGSNSGVYLMGEYEVQILDTHAKKGKLGPGDMGGIYTNAAPRVNAAKPPGEWQKFVIDFQAPRFKDGKKVANARFVKVTLNDQVIHENVEIPKGPTPGGLTAREAPAGPLMFQGNHGPVAFRNIKIMTR